MKKILPILICMMSGCFLSDQPVKKQFEICLAPSAVNDPTKLRNGLQTDFNSVTRTVDNAARKYRFTASVVETIAPYLLKRYYRNSGANNFQEITILADGKTNVICVEIRDKRGTNEEVKNIATELRNDLQNEFNDRIKWQEYN